MPTRTITKVRIDRFAFAGLHGCESQCGLHVERLGDGRILVVFTELEDNPGTSVTNAIETLASTVASHLALDPSKVIWIEHYPPGKTHGKTEDWDLVTFDRILHDGVRSVFFDPSWRPVGPEDRISIGADPTSFVL